MGKHESQNRNAFNENADIKNKYNSLSFVIPCYCSSLTISSVVSEITTKMQIYEYNYEIILVNDSSLDDTFQKITELCISDKHIIGIDLAKNFGQHAAIMAGLLYVSGDIIMVLVKKCVDYDYTLEFKRTF